MIDMKEIETKIDELIDKLEKKDMITLLKSYPLKNRIEVVKSLLIIDGQKEKAQILDNLLKEF
ncbi:MAG: hypothetical protein HPY53_12440 [Brevinematales bacterium]|nr:hypothetical protein [Brevinematales bacterium]